MNDATPRTLGSYIRVKHGFAFKGEHFTETETPDVLVTPGNFAIGGGFLDDKPKYYAGPVPDNYILEEGDLVVTMTDLSKAGDTLGYPALVPQTPGRRYVHNQRIGLVEIKEGTEVDRRFLFYRLRANDYRHHILATASGSTVRHTSPGQICEFEMTLPAITKQRAIAEVLGSLDDKIALNRRTNRALEAMSQAIFKAWFINYEPVKAKAEGATSFQGMPQGGFDQLPAQFVNTELGPVPSGWDVVPLSDLIELIGGGTPKRKVPLYWGGSIPWFSVRDAPMEHDVWVVETEEHITEEGVDNSSAKIMREGTTIISARGTVGRLALTAVPMAMNQSCYGIQGTQGIGDYFTYFTIHHVVVDLQQRTHGSVFDTITRNTFDTLQRVKPQEELLAAYEAAATPLLELIRRNIFENCVLTRMRDALLPKLISGEIRLPEDGEVQHGG